MDSKGHAGRRHVKKGETEMQHFDAAGMSSSFVRDNTEWPKDENMALKSQPSVESQFRYKFILKSSNFLRASSVIFLTNVNTRTGFG